MEAGIFVFFFSLFGDNEIRYWLYLYDETWTNHKKNVHWRGVIILTCIYFYSA